MRCLVRRDLQTGQQGGVEARLQSAHGHELPVGAGEAAVEGCPAVQQVGAALAAPQPSAAQGVEQGGQHGRAVGHGGVHDPAAPGAFRLQQGGQQPHKPQHGPAAIVADQVQGRRRRPVRRADGVQGAGQADVVDVVPHLIRQRPRLAPTGDAGEDQRGVHGVKVRRAETQPLHDPGAEALDDPVSAGDQIQDACAVGLAFQIHRHRRTAPVQHLAPDLVEHRRARRGAAGQAQDIGAEIGQHHAGEGHGTEAVELEDADAGEGFHAARLSAAWGRRDSLHGRYPAPRVS